MSPNQITAVHTAILSALDLNAVFASGVDPQEIVDAAKTGTLHGPLTQFFVERKWAVAAAVSLVESQVEVVPGQLPDLSRHTHNPNVPLIGHGEVEGSTLFRGEPGTITYWNRDGNLDHWFPDTDPRTPASTARILITPKVMKLKEMAKWVTGCPKDTIGALSRAIVHHNLDMTRAQWNALIRETQSGKDYLLTNGYANFAFAKTGKILNDEDGEYPEIVVLYARRDADGRWGGFVYRLVNGLDWSAGLRLVLRNCKGHSA